MKREAYGFIGGGEEYKSARAVIFGAPFDGTTSFRPGARFGPAAVRAESFGIETYSPYQRRDLEDILFFDSGDLELPPGGAERALELISQRTREIASDGKLSVMLGGEHLVTLGALRPLAELYPELRIIHFDAHADLREEYLGERLSHACVMRRAWELFGDGRIFQMGIRSGDRGEWAFMEHTTVHPFDLFGAEAVKEACDGYPVYISVDLDVLDPSVFPGTGTPEAGGADFNMLLSTLFAFKGMKVVGFDLVELSPQLDHSGASTALCCKLLREMLLAFVS